MPPRPVSKRRGMSIRLRLTLTYTALILATGISMLGLVFLVMATIPGYQFQNGPYPSGSIPGAFVVNDRDDIMTIFGFVSLVALALVGTLGGLVSWIVAGRMLRPLTAVIDLARAVDDSSLGERLGYSGPQDEIALLADTIDSMLERLQESFASRSRFAANASHELRTPLSATKTMLQVALKGKHDAATRTTLERLFAVNEQMIATTAALLDLAGTGPVTAWHSVDLRAATAAALAELEPEIRRRRLTLNLHLDLVRVDGNPALLRQLVSNLLRNAVVHNRDDGCIEVALAHTPAGVTLLVGNTGAVLAPEQMPLLLEPFYRAALRTGTGSRSTGHGLGLALVNSIAQSHRAELELTPGTPDGLSVRVFFPVPSTETGEAPAAGDGDTRRGPARIRRRAGTSTSM